VSGGHSHGPRPAGAGSAAAQHTRPLAIAFGLTAACMVAELVGGLVTGSLALLSDAAHMFTDAAALAIALAAAHLSRRPADTRRTFGYHRFEVLAAALNAVLLLLASCYILVEAVLRAITPEPVESSTMLLVAVLGLVTNLVGMWLLHAGRHENLNLRGAYLEVWSDMLGSIGVIAGALVIRATGWLWVDPLVAALIGLWVLPRAWQLLHASAHVLLEGTPEGIELDEVEQALLAAPGVAGVHDLHVWSLGSSTISLSAHVVMREDAAAEPDGLLEVLRARMSGRFGIHHCTIQLERHACHQAGVAHTFEPAGGPSHDHAHDHAHGGTHGQGA
jgi:cobalt-zinc-cadmium efflux system protein